MKYIETEHHLADVLTKSLDAKQLEHLRNAIGVYEDSLVHQHKERILECS